MRALPRTAPLVLAGLLVIGCGGADDPGADEVPAAEPPQDAPEDDAEDQDVDGVDGDLEGWTAQVVAEVAEEQGVTADEVTVVTAEEVTWPDGALGCPEDDGMYTQALVEGYRVVVEVEGAEHHYHGSDGQPPFRCDEPQPPAEGGS